MPKVPLDKIRQFPHMMPGDIEIWEAFLKQYTYEFYDFRYDVHVGKGYVLTPDAPDWAKKHARIVTQKRIDVVARKGGLLYVIEVKPDAGLAAFGQAQAYRYLLQAEWTLDTLPHGAIITDFLDDDTRKVLELHDITPYIVQM